MTIFWISSGRLYPIYKDDTSIMNSLENSAIMQYHFSFLFSMELKEKMTNKTILNIAAYKFVELDDLSQRRNQLLERCYALSLKGTILLSIEGINLSLAGEKEAITDFKFYLTSQLEFADLEFKESYSANQPFNHMFVKIKKEIIAFGVPSIQPTVARAPSIVPQQLKQWLDQGHDDEGREVVLLDARNTYEIQLGKFKDAIDLNIAHFRDFTTAINNLPTELKQKRMVTYCTGGIRCEKAALLLQQQGYDIFQLEGGILNYFKECQGEHYEGECFIYDQRVALDAELQETDSTP